jgi:hypothetical protein
LVRRRTRAKLDSPFIADDLASLGRNLLKQGKASGAEPLLRECLAIREKTMPKDYRRYVAMSLLGAAVMGQ